MKGNKLVRNKVMGDKARFQACKVPGPTFQNSRVRLQVSKVFQDFRVPGLQGSKLSKIPKFKVARFNSKTKNSAAFHNVPRRRSCKVPRFQSSRF